MNYYYATRYAIIIIIIIMLSTQQDGLKKMHAINAAWSNEITIKNNTNKYRKTKEIHQILMKHLFPHIVRNTLWLIGLI